ncbi:MAG TPA: TerC family protein [Polyangiaceae bacterium]|nr:TerC family protein [Polyangiaceae bacterium]
MDVFLTAHGWLSLATLAVLEIVLGIDNIIFIALMTNQVPPSQRARVRNTGIALALITRLLLLLALSWVMTLVRPWFQIAGHEFSGRDLILLGGGLFLMAKATREVAHKVEIASRDDSGSRDKLSTSTVLAQIVVLDIIFSLDSVVTAVGMANELVIMVTAMVLAVGVMLAFSGKIARFIQRHPSMQILALSFLILIGATLVVEGWGGHINKGYIYFAMCFALAVDSVQLWAQRKNRMPVPLHSRTDEPPAGR